MAQRVDYEGSQPLSQGWISTPPRGPSPIRPHSVDAQGHGRSNRPLVGAVPVHLGTALDTRGGISAVLQVYQRAGFFDAWGATHVVSHTDRGTRRDKAATALAAWQRVFKLQLQRAISVLHVHTASGPSFWRKVLISAPVLLSRTPVVLHVHGGGFEAFYQRSAPLAQWLIRSVLERSARVIALTPEWATTLARLAPKARIEVLVNPVEMTPAADVDCAAASHRQVVLFLGLLQKSKGAHDLVQAFARIPTLPPKATLVMAGVGDVDGLKDLAHSLGIADRVLFPGWIGPKEKNAWFKQAACLALPSYAEGLPMAVLEAMAHKVPVIASAVGGIPGVVQPGATGWLMTPGDVETLAAHLGRVLKDGTHQRHLGAAGRQLVEQDYAAGPVIARLGQLYRDLGVSPRNS